MKYALDPARTDLSDLVAKVQAGEEVTILRGDEPVARLVPMETHADSRAPDHKHVFKFGILADVLKDPIPDFFEPMDEDELRLWEGGD